MHQQKRGPATNYSTTKGFDYNISTENRMTRQGGGMACIYKDDLTVEKIKTHKRAIFELQSLKIKRPLHIQPLALIYRTPY